MGKVVLKDDELLGYINQKKTAQQIIDESGVTLLTLQKRVGKLQQSHKKFYDVPGLFEEEGETIKIGQAGIRISKAKLEGFGYQLEDKFELKHDDKKKQIILSKVE